MGTIKTTSYICDLCGKPVKACNSTIDIVTDTSSSPGSCVWSRLHILIQHHHGVHNSSTREDAILHQNCAIHILTDALNRVKNGERATKGSQSIYEEKWSE